MKQKKTKSRMDSTWLLPILAILGSASSMIAIGILLAHFNDRPVFDWNGVTLNAIIAVFSVMSKAMLAYTLSECLGQAKWIWFSSRSRSLNDIDLIDSASRGPLGSFQILTHHPVVRSFISMGAIIVILSAVIDPFIQLTIGQKDRVTFENSSDVQIAYANRFSKEWFIDSDSNAAPMQDLKMQAAVLEGLSQPDAWISQQTQYTCPSGNCTWDTFTSLSICSACNDVTNQIEKIHWGISKSSVGQPPEGEQSDQAFIYLLPNGLVGEYDIPMTGLGSVDRNESISFTAFDTLIWSMTMMNVTNKRKPTGDIGVSVSAVECGLWYCVNSYHAAVENGNFIETMRPAPSKKNPNSWLPVTNSAIASVVAPLQLVLVDGVPIELLVNGTLPLDYVNPPHHGPLDVPSARALDERTDLQLGEGFNVSQAAILTIATLFYDTLANVGLTRNHSDDPYKYNAIANKYSFTTDGANSYEPPSLEYLYHSQNLEATFSTLARSLTNHIRRNSDNHTVFRGKGGHNIIFFRIRAWFLILPIVVIFAGAVFLGVVLHQTHMAKMEFWGTNTLPIVALGEQTGAIFDEMNKSTMTEKAKRQFVQFSTLQPRRDFDRADTTSRNENIEMISPSRISEISNPPADVASIDSPSRTSEMQNPSADVASIVSHNIHSLMR